MDIFGAFLMLRSPLLIVPVIQLVSGCELAILPIFSHFYLKEIMNAVDWLGIALAAIGTIEYHCNMYLPRLALMVSILLTRGLNHGRAMVVSTCAAVASIVTGVLAGMLALGERSSSALTAQLLLLLGC